MMLLVKGIDQWRGVMSGIVNGALVADAKDEVGRPLGAPVEDRALTRVAARLTMAPSNTAGWEAQ